MYIHNPPGKFAAKWGPTALTGFIAAPVIAPKTITSTQTTNPQHKDKVINEPFWIYEIIIICLKIFYPTFQHFIRSPYSV